MSSFTSLIRAILEHSVASSSSTHHLPRSLLCASFPIKSSSIRIGAKKASETKTFASKHQYWFVLALRQKFTLNAHWSGSQSPQDSILLLSFLKPDCCNVRPQRRGKQDWGKLSESKTSVKMQGGEAGTNVELRETSPSWFNVLCCREKDKTGSLLYDVGDAFLNYRYLGVFLHFFCLNSCPLRSSWPYTHIVSAK